MVKLKGKLYKVYNEGFNFDGGGIKFQITAKYSDGGQGLNYSGDDIFIADSAIMTIEESYEYPTHYKVVVYGHSNPFFIDKEEFKW